MTDQSTQPLTDAELARIDKICEGGWTPAGLDQGRLWVTLTRHREANQVLEQAAILAVQTKDEVVAENARLRAENTALAARLGTILSYVNQPTTPERAAGMVTARRFVNDLMGVKSEPNQWEQMTPALGLDQNEEGQA